MREEKELVEVLNIADPHDLIILQQRLRDCRRASAEARNIASTTTDAEVREEMETLADKLDTLSSDLNAEIEDTKEANSQEVKSEKDLDNLDIDDDGDNPNDETDGEKPNQKPDGDLSDEDSEDSQKSDTNSSDKDTPENEGSDMEDGDINPSESENSDPMGDVKEMDISKETTEMGSPEVDKSKDDSNSANETDSDGEDETDSEESNGTDSEETADETSNDGDTDDDNSSPVDSKDSDSGSNSEGPEENGDNGQDDSESGDSNNNTEENSSEGENSENTDTDNSSSNNSNSNEDSSNEDDSGDSSDGEQGGQSDSQSVKNPFADEDDIPQLSGNMGEEPRDPTIDEIIKILKSQEGDAKRGIIDGLKQLLSGDTNLTESKTLNEAKTLIGMSDDEYGDFINDVWDKIKKHSPEVTFRDDDEERKNNREQTANNNSALDIEDAQNRDVDRRGMRNKDQGQSAYGCKSIKDLERNLKKFLADQIEETKEAIKDWAAENDFGDDDILVKITDYKWVDQVTRPRVEFYIDRSSSWGQASDVAVARKVINTVNKLNWEGVLDVEIFYFDDIITTNENDYRLGNGLTLAFSKIQANIAANKTTNVIIMTDDDMDNARRALYSPSGWAGSYSTLTVPGRVWYIWRPHTTAPILASKIVGKRGTGQYMFM